MITLRELFEEALLSLPKTDDRLTLTDLRQGIRFKGRGGVYVFYNIHHEPLYVGISNRLDRRVPEHLSSSKGNKDLIHYIDSGKYVYVDVFYEDDKLYQEVYESYLIYQLNPRFNVGKTGREKI
jgi:hypothetical protein